MPYLTNRLPNGTPCQTIVHIKDGEIQNLQTLTKFIEKYERLQYQIYTVYDNIFLDESNDTDLVL